MNRKERRAAQKRGGPIASPAAAALAAAFRAHQAGHRTEAERLYREVLGLEPGNAAALHLLGALAHQSGRTDEAVTLIGQAIAIEPRNADFHYNLGSILQAAGRLDDAATHLQKAIALNPKYTEAHFELAGVYARQERWADAAEGFRRVLTARPNDAATLNNLGMVLREQGQIDEAIALWQRAVQASPSFYLAHMNLGLAHKAQGRADEATASLKRALELAPNSADAVYNLAAALLDQGRHEAALQMILRGLDRSETAELRELFAVCLQTMRQIPADDRVRNLIGRAVSEGWSRPEQLASVAAAVLKRNAVIANGIASVNRHWPASVPITEMLPPGSLAAIAQDALLAAALASAPVTDIDFERFLTGLRFALLASARQNEVAGSEAMLRLVCALARQCFLNGYVWPQSEDEATRLRDLQNAIAAALQSGRLPEAQWLAAIAAYVPLHSLSFADQLARHDWPEPVRALLDQHITQPADERALRVSIEAIDPTPTASAEEPSPRWTSIAPSRRPVTIDAYLRNGFPQGSFRPLGKTGPLDILVAGCRTGQSAIEIAGRHAAPNVLAVDPSPANLAYAARQARDCGRSNITFAVCQDLNAITQSFDVIDATGIPMANDAAGSLMALASRLRAGGFMLVAIEGERLRQAIDTGQEIARGGNYQPDDEGIRLLRQTILRLPEAHAARALASRAEFYTTAACRDQLLSVRQHPLTLANAAALFAEAGLMPIGFDVDPRVTQRYRNRFPQDARMTDLANWQSLERAEPDMAAMTYNVWLQKRWVT